MTNYLFLQIPVLRYILQESITVVLVIHATTVMLKPVADNQIIHFQHHVVTGNLVENFLGDFYLGSLVFHNHPGGEVTPVKHRVTAFLCTVQLYLHLICHQCLRIAFVSKKKVDEVLPHPFFGRQGDITTADYIENNIFPFLAAILASNAGRFNDNIYYICKLNNGSRLSGTQI